MKSHTAYLTFNTKKRTEIIPITNDVERIIRESGVQEGLALVSAMHLTASVIIQDEESGLHRDRYRMASPGGIASWEIGSPAHVVNQELQGFLTSLGPVLAASSIHAQTRNNDEG